MRIEHAQIEWDGYRLESVRPDRIVRVTPEPGAPKGRKARQMADLWSMVRPAGTVGILWQDPDIVTEPTDIDAMRIAARGEPGSVWVALHRLWPASTGRPDWCWGFGPWDEPVPVMTKRIDMAPRWFALGLTYTPGRLLDLARPHMPAWEYGQTDMGLSRLAREHGIPVRVCASAMPKHLHFYSREGDATWRPEPASVP